MTYSVWVRTQATGSRFRSTSARFATRDEANYFGIWLLWRFDVVCAFEVAASNGPVSHRFEATPGAPARGRLILLH